MKGQEENKIPMLSKRMKLAADMITKGSRVADIGCDHGYVSIYLYKSGIAPLCIASDINKGPLEAARKNTELFDAKGVELRLSNGLEKYKSGEVQSILITGMGGSLMADILSDGAEVVRSALEIVLEPQSEYECVRKSVNELGFYIVDEEMIVECGKYYPVMRAVRSKNVKKLQKYELLYGPCLIKKKNPVLKEYLEREKKRLNGIIDELSKHMADKARKRCNELKKEIEYINTAEEMMR